MKKSFLGAFALFKNYYAKQNIEQRSQSCPHSVGYPEWKSFCRNRQQADARAGAYDRQHGKFHVFQTV